MRSDRPNPWTSFLDAERGGRGEESERALGELFRELPRPRPAAGFAARVMARIGRRSPFARPAVQVALAAALAAVALAAALLLPAVGPLAGLVGPASVLHLLIVGFADLVARVAQGLELWSTVASVSRTLGATALAPSVFALLVIQLLIAVAALRALSALAHPQRSSPHVSA